MSRKEWPAAAQPPADLSEKGGERSEPLGDRDSSSRGGGHRTWGLTRTAVITGHQVQPSRRPHSGDARTALALSAAH